MTRQTDTSEEKKVQKSTEGVLANTLRLVAQT
jgi:hypothetical protein